MALLKSVGSQNRPRKLLIQPSAYSPFCTSPSQLQEVTLDPDATNFSCVGMRSPGALPSGRTVKEIDEQLSSLKKENFNLKLRIYFLEERMGSNFSANKEDIMKKNIELQVELANLQTELEGKQELLCQAAKAMEIEEEENKREICMRDQEIHSLKEMLERVQHELKNEREEIKQVALCAEAFDLNGADDDTLDIVKKLQAKIHDLQEELKSERDRTGHFNMMAETVREKCKAIEMQVFEKDHEIETLTTEIHDSNEKLAIYEERVQKLEDIVVEKSVALEEVIKQMTAKDDDFVKQKLNLDDANKLYSSALDEKSRLEKKIEKYKWQSCICEKKNEELSVHVDMLKSKIHSLEMRVSATMDKYSGVESIASTDEKFKSKSNDDSTFSVRMPEMSPKAVSTKAKSPLKVGKSYSPSNNALFCDADEDFSTKNRNDKKESCETNESPFTQDEILELKKNHFKACKIIRTMIQKKKEYMEQIDNLQKSVVDKGDEIKTLKKKISDLSEYKPCLSGECKKRSIKDKVSEMNLTASLNRSDIKENLMAEDNDMELSERYKELANELEEKIEILTATLAEKDSQLERFQMNIQEKTDRIIDLEFELLALSNDISNEGKDNVEEERELKIQQLENELRKRTGDLQGLVNKELWEKNRTIEKLQTAMKAKNESVCKLEKSHSNKDLQLKILKDKINELGVHVDVPLELSGSDQTWEKERVQLIRQNEQLKLHKNEVPEHENDDGMERLQIQCERLRDDLSKSEKLRQEEREICTILNNRLEELCHFLQSLLKHKAVLGFLGNEQSRQLHQALNKSLEFSQILSNSICKSVDESSIANILNSTRNDNISFTNLIDEDNSTFSIIPNDITLTYRSYLNRVTNESDVITVLRQQIANLKHEIEVRDVELERIRNEPSSKIGELERSPVRKQDNQSESESWSEPDRSVSLARIGLEDECSKRPNARRRIGEPEGSTETTEDEKNHSKTPSKRATLAESRQTIIALHEQICDLEASLKQKDNQLVSVQMSHYETDKLLKLEQGKLETLRDENRKLLTTIAEYSTEAEESRELMNHLRTEQTQLLAQLGGLRKELDFANTQKNELEGKIVELKNIILALEEFKTTTLINISIKDKQIQNTLNEMEIERSKLIETSKNLENSLEKVKTDLQKAHAEFQRVCLREEQVRQQLERKEEEFAKKEEEMESLRKDYEIKLIGMKEINEKDYITKNTLQNEVDHLKLSINNDAQKIHLLEAKINDMHKELNSSNLNYSEIMLEKSKMKSENNALQGSIQKLKERNLEMSKELNDLRSAQAAIKSLSCSLPMNLNGNVSYRRQISDHSGYASEDLAVEQNRILDLINQHINALDATEDQDRLHASASPDLGIESDQGRFSSLEANINIPRPFLPSLEIAQNMNELLDPVEDLSCANEECCKKAKQIANENVDLRKRLLRTRRALEDTLNRLTLANKQKKEIEKSICKQIHKTSQVLRKAKANLDSGSETDNVKS